MTDRVHNYGGNSKISVQGIREARTATNTSQRFGVLGDCKPLGQDREVIYAMIGSSAVSAGHLVQAPGIAANHQNRAVAITASIGATEVTIVIGATGMEKDAYRDGTLLVTSGTGTGYSYMIQGNISAAASSTACKVILKDGLELALNTASIVSLIQNRCHGVLVCGDSAALTGVVQGVTLISAAASSYVYLGKRGEWPVKLIGGTVIGQAVARNTACTTGAAGPVTSAGETVIGLCRQTAVADSLGLVDFKL